MISGSANITGVTFDVLTKGGTIAGSGMGMGGYDYRFTAGRVRSKDKTGISGATLYLDPEKATSNLRILDSGTFAMGIVAGGTGNAGLVTIGTYVVTPSLTIGEKITTTLTQDGSLNTAAGGPSSYITNNGTLVLSVVSGAKTLSNQILGSGTVRKTDAGSLTLTSGPGSSTGKLFVDEGVLVTPSLPTQGDVTVNGGELSLSNNVTAGTLTLNSGALSLSGGLGGLMPSDYRLAAGSITLKSGVVTARLESIGGNPIVKSSGGTVLLNSQSNAGAFRVQEGTLRLGVNNAFDPTRVTLTMDGGELALGTTQQSIMGLSLNGGLVSGGSLILGSGGTTLSAGTISSALSDTGTQEITKTGTGTVLLSGSTSLSGKMNLNAGTLQLGGTAKLTSGILAMNGGNLVLNGTNQRVSELQILSGAAFDKNVSAQMRADNVKFNPNSVLNIQSGEFVFTTVTGSGGTVNVVNGGLLNGDKNGQVYGAPLGSLTVNLKGGEIRNVDFASSVTFNLGSASGTGTASVTLNDSRIQGTAVIQQPVNLSVTSETEGGVTRSRTASINQLSGSGSFTKSDVGSLTLTQAVASSPFTGSVSVTGGTLTATDLLTGARKVTTSLGATLDLTLSGGTVYSGTLSGGGNVRLSSSSPATLQLGSPGKLDGNLSLLTPGLTVDTTSVSSPSGPFGDYARLNLLANGTLKFGATQELELLSISVTSGKTLTLDGNGGKILYDDQPSFISAAGTLIAGTTAVTVVGTTPTFDVITKGGATGGGAYLFTAGRVRDKLLAAGSMLTGTVLELDPLRSTTTIRIKDTVAFSQGIVAGGSNGGSVSIETLAYTPAFNINAGLKAILADGGSLQTSSTNAAPSSIVNNGSLQVSVLTSSKTVANVISGQGLVEKVDSGVLKLTGNNSYTGGTTLSGGFVQIKAASSLGAGSITFNGGGLQFEENVGFDVSARIKPVASGKRIIVDTNGADVTFAAALSGDGGLRKSGLGTLILAADDSALLDQLAVDQGTLQVGNASVQGVISGSVNIAEGAIMRLSNSRDTTFAQQISGAGTVEQAGSGKVTVSGNNVGFAGTTILRSGTLTLASSNALGSSGALIFGGGILQYGTASVTDYSSRISSGSGQIVLVDTNGRDVQFDSVFGGSGNTSLTKMGFGTLSISKDNAFTGRSTVNGGTLVFSGSQSGRSPITLSSGRVQYNLSDTQSVASLVSSSQSTATGFNVSGGTALFSGSLNGAGAFEKSGNGTLQLGKSLTNTGGAFVNAGTLELISQASLAGSITVNSGAVLNALSGSFGKSSMLSLAGTLQLGNSCVYLKSVALDSANVLMVSGVSDDEATILAGSVTGTLSNGSLSTSNVRIIRISEGNGSTPTVISGSLSGTLSGLPSGAVLSLQKNSKGKPVFLPGNDVLDQLTATDGVDLRITGKTTVAKALDLSTGGTLSLSGDAGVSAASIILGSSSKTTLGGNAVVTTSSLDVADGSSVVLSGSSSVTSDILSVRGGATVELNNLAAVQNIGVLQIGTSSTSSGTLKVNAGTLQVGGGAITQVLKGSGRIDGDISIGRGSVLSPGNSPGLLTITNATVTAGASLILEYGGPTIADQDRMTGGTLNFQNGAVITIVDYNRSLVKAGTSYRPFAGVTTVTGTASVAIALRLGAESGTPGDDGVAYRKGYSAAYSATIDNGTVSISRNSLQSLGNFSGNIQGFAAAVNARQLTLANAAAANGGAFSASAVDEIGTGDSPAAAAANIRKQLLAANPAAYAELGALSFQRTLNIGQVLFDHFSSVRNRPIGEESGLTAWTTGYGTWHRQSGDANNGTVGFSGNSWGDLLGVEKRQGNLLLGVSASNGRTSANFLETSGSVTTYAWNGSAYAMADLDGTSLELGVLYGNTESNVRRTVAATGLTTRQGLMDISGTELLLHVGAAKLLKFSNNFTLTPSARLLVQSYSLESASESGLDGLEVTTLKQRKYTLSHQVGLELAKRLMLMDRPSYFSGKLDWIHRYEPRGHALDMQLGNDESTRFGYRGSDAGGDSVRVGGAFETSLSTRVTLRANLDFETKSRAHTVQSSLSLGYSF